MHIERYAILPIIIMNAYCYDAQMSTVAILVSAALVKVQTIFSFWRSTPNLFMLPSCLAYRVHILFKCIWGLRNIQRQ